MKIIAPTVGPIVGQADKHYLRIMARGKESTDKQSIVCILKEGSKIAKRGAKFRVVKTNPTYDMTGVVIFSGLKPDTQYTYKVGYVKEAIQDVRPNGLNWDVIPENTIRTLSDDDSKEIAVCAGSCRYIAETSIGEENTWSRKWFWIDSGDKTYRSIVRDHADISHMIMCGDQVYMDDLNALGATDSLFEAREKYKAAFGAEHSPHMAKLLATKPTFMILDDHEIEDNWPASASGQNIRNKYVNTMQAYQSYQASHSPLMDVQNDIIVARPNKWYYTYTDGCADFFVLDTRTERKINKKLSLEERRKSKEIWNHRIMTSAQINDLLNWLGDGSGRVKCIVSSVPFFPDYEDGSDQWGEFWHQRDKVIDYCVEKNIKKVISITGDIHVSYTSVLTKPGTDFKMIQVVSSPIFWPFGHGSVDDYPNIGNKEEAELNGRSEFKINTPTKVIATDNFSRLDISPSELRVRVYSRKGEALEDNSFTF